MHTMLSKVFSVKKEMNEKGTAQRTEITKSFAYPEGLLSRHLFAKYPPISVPKIPPTTKVGPRKSDASATSNPCTRCKNAGPQKENAPIAKV